MCFCATIAIAQKQPKNCVIVKNALDVKRSFETVEIKKSDLKDVSQAYFLKLGVQDIKTKEILVSQLVDTNQDGEMDVILFQPKIEPKSEKKFQLIFIEDSKKTKITEYCYSRFVPERTDDYAWENNKVAFRTYGPDAQYRFENNLKEATLSSGIDAWLKRVEYPIINKWYKKATDKIGSYHKDDGEGLDNFHVGVSRGVGGIAVKNNGEYHVSKNFTSWKTITTGPIRTSFVLEYANWDANGQVISEKKHISLDYGSNLSKFEIAVSGTDAIHAGLTLHIKEGQQSENKSLGWISYWESLDDSELGTGIVVPNNSLISTEFYDTELKDQSNYYAEIKVNNQKALYYAGFGWKKAGKFKTKVSWESYLNAFALKINNPLLISFE